MEAKTVSKHILSVKRLFEEQASRSDVSLYEQLFSEDVELYGPASGQVVKGLAALKKVDQGYYGVYSGTQFKIEEIFEHGDNVVVRWTCKGTYKEGTKGIKPKNEAFCISGIAIYRFANGKIREIRQSWDRLGILEQIGEIRVRTDPVEPGYYAELLRSLGMEKYLEKASVLTRRERQCLELLLQGKTAKETASALKLSPRTVESYFENMKQKLKCHNKGELFSIAQALQRLELL